MKYGHFSKDSLEYVITTPTTPRPWINYLTNETYCSIISQCAGGYSFYKDCRTNRITRWAPENWHFDRPGKYIYVRDGGKTFSLTYQPIRTKPSQFECRHGLGYTTISAVNNGLASEVTYFVPEHDDCEVWIVSLTNKTKKTKNLEVFPYVEFLIGDYHEELRYRNIMNLYSRIWFDKSHQAIYAKKTAQWQGMNIQPFDSLIFFASSLPVKGCCTQKDVFLGRCNTEENPEGILEGKFQNFPLCSGEDGIGTFRHSIKLAPGQTKEFTICLGQTEKIPTITKVLEKYRDVSHAKKELQATKNIWKKRIADNIVIETPDQDFNTMMNVWVKYQVYICNLWSRSPSFYHEGSGGRGYRDSCQDSEGICSINPELTRKKILKIASLIRRDGTSAPGWSDTTGPNKHRPNKDHQVWLTATVSAYIKETGDQGILSEYVPYLKDQWVAGWEIDRNWKGGAQTDGEGTLFEHLEKNLEFCFNDVGEKGFPRIGHADWNDAIDAAGIRHKGESVWLAQALVRSLKILADLCERMGDQDKKNKYLQMAKTMDERVNTLAWDGAWYVRGFDDDGVVYGSAKDKEGKRIYINTQAWAILSGVAREERLKTIVESADKYLNGAHGFALFYPAYSSWVKRLGRISMFSEGTKENAAVFCHAATFMLVGLAMAGYGDKAYEAMRKIMPNAQKDMDLYKTEPYIYSEYLVGPENPYRYGEGAFTWITGTSGWTFMAGTEWVLGARRDFDGLRVDPCIPKKWKKCSIRRPFRGDIYDIEILNPKGKEKGVTKVVVDGNEIEGNLITPFNDGKVHKVQVTLG
ncbi:MAG: hypothetical protein WC676_01405 [Candidatus Omnitrophota bacterium]